MPAVNAADAIAYGFRIIGYFIIVAVVGFVVMLIGGGFLGASGGGPMGGGPNIGGMLFGGIIFLVGILVFYAGTFGVLYKVIADGVKAGVEAAR